jgi:hypothetical protein
MIKQAGAVGLRDVHLAIAPVWYWPLGLYAQILGVIFAIGLMLGVYGLHYYRHPLRQLRRQALLALVQLGHHHLESAQYALWLGHYTQLLKRFARKRFPDAQVDGLHGRAWVHFLIKHSMQGCWEGYEALFVQGVYQKQVQYDRKELIGLAQKWIISQTGSS